MKLNVKTKILLIASMPLLVAMWFMVGSVLDKYSIVQEMNKQEPASALLINTGRLIEEIQKERGLSFLHLLNGDDDLSKVTAQYSQTNKQIVLFKSFTANFTSENYSDKLDDRLNNTIKAIESIKQIRTSVSSSSITNKAVINEYSNIVDMLFSTANMPIQYGSNREIIRARRSMESYMQAQESVALEQAVLTRAFKKDSFADGEYALFSTLDTEEQTYLEIFYSLATDEQLLAFAMKQADPIMAENQRIHDIATSKGIAPESTIHIVALTQEFGYGGAIHSFKNYILRKDEKYAASFEQSYQKINGSVNVLNELFANDKRNLRYLKKISATIENYRDAIPQVRALIKDGLSTARIDSRVKINDKPAIISIGALVNSSLSGNFSVDPIHWYDNVTAKLNLMTEVNNSLSDYLTTLVTQQKESAWNSLITMIAVISFVIIIVLVTVFTVARDIISPLNKTVDFALSIANGDLTGKLDINRTDEIGVLANSVNQMSNNLKNMVQEINTTTNQLAQAATEVTVITTKTTKDVTQQQDELQMIATAMNEMSNTVESIANNALYAKNATDKANTESTNGQQVVTLTSSVINEVSNEVANTSSVIQELEKDAESIGKVLGVIRDIAEQTNLLALNASIEAARAGEQGRGFSVVADEVRILASRTQQATLEIQQMIERLQSGSDKAVKAMAKGSEKTITGVEQANKARETLEVIMKSVSEVADINALIATSTEEQTATTGEIDKSITSINLLASETACGAEKTSKSISELAHLANNLKVIVEKFKV